jgi:hypothetical protein
MAKPSSRKQSRKPEVIPEPPSLATEELRGMFADYNPRKMSEHDMAILKRSLQKFELVQPIVVNHRTVERGWEPKSAPVVVGGHQRVRAASEIGIESLEVRWVNLDQAMERELNVVMNRNSGEFDDAMLQQLLTEIEELGGDLEMTGFTADEMEKLMQSFSTEGGDLPDLSLGGGFLQMTFVLSEEQAEVVREAVGRAIKHLSGPDSSGNENHNGNGLHLLCSEYSG